MLWVQMNRNKGKQTKPGENLEDIGGKRGTIAEPVDTGRKTGTRAEPVDTSEKTEP